MAGRKAERLRDGPSSSRGTLLLLASALCFSSVGLFTHLAPVPLWPMVFWRNGFGCLGLAALLVLRARSGLRGRRPVGARAWGAMACSAFATVCYLAAFSRTSVADIAIIYAAAPLVSAALGWICLGERPARRTVSAAAAALGGVALTMAGGAEAGGWIGDALALLMTVALSVVAVLARGSALPPLETALGSSLLACVAVLPPALAGQAGLGLGGGDLLTLAAFGLVTMTLALPTYIAGAALLPPARAMLLSAAEMPLAPLWVWLAFGDVPRPSAILGGIVVAAAVLWDVAGRSPQ